MLFEGEITEDLMMLVYSFAIFIGLYVIFAVVLFFGHRKGKQYEHKKRQLVLQEEYISSETRKTQESSSGEDQKKHS